MKTFLISGTQLDGEHEYTINSLYKGDEVTAEEAQEKLVRDHAFGCVSDGDGDDDADFDDSSTYGDGLTAISYEKSVELTEEQLEVIHCLGLVY